MTRQELDTLFYPVYAVLLGVMLLPFGVGCSLCLNCNKIITFYFLSKIEFFVLSNKKKKFV